MPRTPSAFPFSGRLRRRAINPTPPKRVKAWGDGPLRPEVMYPVVEHTRPNRAALNHSRSRAPHHRTQKSFAGALYLSYVPPTYEYGTRPCLRWVLSQGRSPTRQAVPKMPRTPSAFPFSGRLRRRAINPTPPKRVKAWGDGPLRPEVMYPVVEHTRPNRAALNHSRSRAPHHRTQKSFAGALYLSYVPPTYEYGTRPCLRWVLSQGRSPTRQAVPKMPRTPSAFPFSGRLRRRAINPTPPKRVKAWGDGPLRPEVMYPVVEHTRPNRAALNHSRSRAPHHRTQKSFAGALYLSYVPPTYEYGTRPCLRWVLSQGRSPTRQAVPKMPRTPSAFPFSGRLRRRAINPTPPKRVKAWGDGPLRPEVMYPVVEHTRPNRAALNHSRSRAPHHRTQKSFAGALYLSYVPPTYEYGTRPCLRWVLSQGRSPTRQAVPKMPRTPSAFPFSGRLRRRAINPTPPKRVKAWGDGPLRPEVMYPVVEHTRPNRAALNHSRSRAPHHRTQKSFAGALYLSYVPPTYEYGTRPCLRWVLSQGRSPTRQAVPKMPRTPSAFPFSGRLRRRAINPTPPKRVKAWGDGPLRPEVMYPVVEHTRPNRAALNHSRSRAPHHRTQKSFAGARCIYPTSHQRTNMAQGRV